EASPDTGTSTYTFVGGAMATKKDARNQQASYSYDALNRTTKIVYSDQTISYAYDTCANGKGRLCSISDASGTTSYTYDFWGRITSKNYAPGGHGPDLKVSYGYNAVGQRNTITTPSGQAIGTAYANNRASGVMVNTTTLLNQVIYEPFGPN